MNMDEIDKHIIRRLLENARAPYTDIAKELKVSEATIRKRVNKLIKEGVIRKFTIELGETGLKAIVLIRVRSGYQIPRVAERVSKIPEVVKAYEVTGDYDIVAEVVSVDPSSLNKAIETIREEEGVESTLSMVVLAVW